MKKRQQHSTATSIILWQILLKWSEAAISVWKYQSALFPGALIISHLAHLAILLLLTFPCLLSPNWIISFSYFQIHKEPSTTKLSSKIITWLCLYFVQGFLMTPHLPLLKISKYKGKKLFNEISSDPLRSLKIPWDCVISHEVSWDPIRFFRSFEIPYEPWDLLNSRSVPLADHILYNIGPILDLL